MQHRRTFPTGPSSLLTRHHPHITTSPPYLPLLPFFVFECHRLPRTLGSSLSLLPRTQSTSLAHSPVSLFVSSSVVCVCVCVVCVCWCVLCVSTKPQRNGLSPERASRAIDRCGRATPQLLPRNGNVKLFVEFVAGLPPLLLHSKTAR